MPFIEKDGRRILFLHIPKTGGTSIEEALKHIAPVHFCTRAIPKALKIPPEHFAFSDYTALFGDEYFGYVFSIVRNPYHRLESEYRMRSILSTQGLWGAVPEFSLWLENALHNVRKDRGYLANHFRPQVEFLGKSVRVFKYENTVKAALEIVNKEAGLGLFLPEKRYLSSRDFKGQVKWQAHDIQAVNDFYWDDFELLGYQKTDPGFDLVLA